MRVPSGLKATPHTVPVWPVRGCRWGCPVSASHNRTVLCAGGGEPVPVGAERHIVHLVCVPGQRLARVGIPQPQSAVAAFGGQAVSVGAKRHAVHIVGVPGQRRADRLAGICVP